MQLGGPETVFLVAERDGKTAGFLEAPIDEHGTRQPVRRPCIPPAGDCNIAE